MAKILYDLLGTRQEQTTVPVWFMRQAGRHLPEYRALRQKTKDFMTLCLTPSAAAEITLQPVHRYHVDAAILFSDILILPHAQGFDIRFIEGKRPSVFPILTPQNLGLLDRVPSEKNMMPLIETIHRVKDQLPEDVTLIGFAGAPWTVACYLTGGEKQDGFLKTTEWAEKDFETFQVLVEKLTEATILYLQNQIKAGVEAIQLFDSWAGSIPERFFDHFCLNPLKKIVAAVKRIAPHVPIISFPRGAANHMSDIIQAGVEGISMDETVSLTWAKEVGQGKVVLQGQLDPILLLRGGEKMEKEVARILSTMADTPFIFNLGHGILPETPVDHVERVVAMVKEKKRP